jgi:hypothetical protein
VLRFTGVVIVRIIAEKIWGVGNGMNLGAENGEGRYDQGCRKATMMQSAMMLFFHEREEQRTAQEISKSQIYSQSSSCLISL